MKKKELKKYAKLIDDYIKPNIFASCSEPAGILAHPYVDPSAQYAGNLWDWDSFWVIKVMIMALERYKNDPDFDYEAKKKKTEAHAKGTIMNFFDNQEEDGFTPMMMVSGGCFYNYFRDEHKAGKRHNTHKPFLLQNILQICEYWNDYEWFDIEKAVKYLEYYEREQKDERSGLFYWVNDMMIGVDNNPTVFFRRERTSADIFLNSFMVLEYDAMVKLLRARGDGRADEIEKRGTDFKKAVNELMYDKKDHIYYSQDVGFYKSEDRLVANGFLLHENYRMPWKSIPLKVRFWGCFVPLYAGLCDDETAKAIDKAHLHDSAVMAPYGVRTVASDEPSYNLDKTNNPSNWLGGIWIVANYCIYKGLKNCGIKTYKTLAERTIKLLGMNLEKSGEMYESYEPDDGEPCLFPHFFNWDLLVMEMLEDFGE